MTRIAALFFAITALATAQSYRAFWVDAFHKGFKTPQQVDTMIQDVATAKGNAIFIEVRLDGESYYLHSLEPPAEDGEYAPGFDSLQYLIDKAHARGIEVHAWFPVIKLWSRSKPPADPGHAWNLHGPSSAGDAMWMTVSNTGGVSTSVDPGHPAVLRYLADVILEPVKHYNLDGIHLDYIRYPEDANYGWNAKAVERFQRLANRTGTPSPNDIGWGDFRRAQVTALVRQIYLRTAAIRPGLKVSAALITWGNGPETDAEFRARDAYSRVFQNWPAWLDEGIVDLAMPMNYFDNTKYSAYLDRWLAYEKTHQFQRALVPGLGVYLNSIADSISQARRAVDGSSGVAFYSYASTSLLNAAGNPITPNLEFYQAVASAFGDPGPAPALPWKAAPSLGHIYGTVTTDDGPSWLVDGAQVVVESDTGAGVARRSTTDGTGFFGFVDLPPDRYRLRIERAGQVIYRATQGDVNPGLAVNFDVRLTAADFDIAIPKFTADRTSAAPGDLLTLAGWFPGAGAGACQAVVNGVEGTLAPMSSSAAQVIFPLLRADSWRVMIRCDGMESSVTELASVDASPRITGVQPGADRYLSIYATGLGLVIPGLVFPPVAAPVRVLAEGSSGEEVTLIPTFAALIPQYPGMYLVNVQLPPDLVVHSLRLRVGEITGERLLF